MMKKLACSWLAPLLLPVKHVLVRMLTDRAASLTCTFADLSLFAYNSKPASTTCCRWNSLSKRTRKQKSGHRPQPFPAAQIQAVKKCPGHWFHGCFLDANSLYSSLACVQNSILMRILPRIGNYEIASKATRQHIELCALYDVQLGMR